MRLDVALVRHRGLELALEDHVRFAEAGVQVALGELQMRRGVAGVVALGTVHRGRVQAVVKQRRAVHHRIADIEHRRQQLVLDLNQFERVLGDVVVGGRHRGDGVSLVEHLVRRDDVVQHPLEVGGAFAGVDLFIAGAREVGIGDHRLHTVQRLGLGRVNADDPGVRVRAAQDPAGEHPRQIQVGAVLRRAGDFVDTVVTDRPCADDVVLFGFLRLSGDHDECPFDQRGGCG